MSTSDEMLIVLRAAMTMRGVQKARDDLLETNPDSHAYERLCRTARQLEAQFDLALETLRGELMRGDPANDD